MTAEAVGISIDNRTNRVLVRAPYSMKDGLKAIPGAKWAADVRKWTFPVSLVTASMIHALLKQGAYSITMDSRFKELVESIESLQNSAHFKGRDDLEQPEVKRTDAWGHQKIGYHFARELMSSSSGGGVLLAMDMGTGKSKTCIDIIQNTPPYDPPGRKVLIMCPVSVIDVWPEQFRRHAAGDWMVVPLRTSASTAKRASMIEESFYHYEHRDIAVVVNYEATWRGELAKELLKHRWDFAVADECHRLKSASGKASAFAGKLRRFAVRRLGLTGTPLPHSPMDAFGQYRFLDPGVFGESFTRFRSQYAIMGGYGNHQIVGFRNEGEFNRRFYSIAYRVGKEVLDLPEATHITRTCELEKNAMWAYRSLAESFVAELEEGCITAANALTKLLRLQQIASGYVKDDEGVMHKVSEAKRDLLEDLLTDLAEDEPVVVFGRFRSDLDQVHEVAKKLKRGSCELSGRINQLADWQQGGAPIIAVQIQAGGAGIDLTRAHYCVYFSKGFSLGDYQQSLARVHRPGQNKNVFYYHLITKKTVDLQVEEALKSRADVVDFVLGHFEEEEEEVVSNAGD